MDWLALPAALLILWFLYHRIPTLKYWLGAKRGNRDDQFQLALRYEFGYGVRRNAQKSDLWMRRASQQGHPKAREFLADGTRRTTEPLGIPVEKMETIEDVWNEARPEFVQNTSNVLREQMEASGRQSLDDGGIINAEALGYVHGFIDASLQEFGKDITDLAVGIPYTFEILGNVFPGREVQYMTYLKDNLAHSESLATGAMCGGQECFDCIDGKTASPWGLVRILSAAND